MNMSKSKTGALIVIQQDVPLDNYEKSGDIIDAAINTRLIENIFFKNSPLHDGALIIDGGKIKAAGCILPVSHDTNVPRALGLRHRSALGISQATDAFAIVVSEETGNISVAHRGRLSTRLSSTELENASATYPPSNHRKHLRNQKPSVQHVTRLTALNHHNLTHKKPRFSPPCKQVSLLNLQRLNYQSVSSTSPW